jgi:hypothetical protein
VANRRQRKYHHHRASIRVAMMANIDPNAVDYWHGYQRGMRRAHFGEIFGAEDEHRLSVTLAAEGGDRSQRERGRGYRDGLAAK